MGHIQEGDRMQSSIMCLDEMVAKDSMVRIIDKFMSIVDLGALGFINTVPNNLGRNSYAPLTLAKLYVFCYEEGIRSSRRIEKACQTNIEVMWLTGGLRPDFKTIADFRRDNTFALTKLFYEFTSFADSAGLFGKRIVAIDGTKIRASNSKRKNISKKSLKRRIEHHEIKVAQYLGEMDAKDSADEVVRLTKKVEAAKLSADKARSILDDMDEADITEISLTDPDARSMGKGRQGMHVAYNVQAAVDAKNHLVTDIDITNRPDDHGQLINMALRTQETMRKRDITFLADKGYWGSEELKACEEENISCIVAPQGKSKSTQGSLSLDSFIYDAVTDSYTCPKGVKLSCKSRQDSKDKLYSNKVACLACEVVKECKSAGFSYRRVKRRPENEIHDRASKRYNDNLELYSLRQQIAEHPFGTVKRFMGGDHFLLRGLDKVRCEAALLFTGYNLKRSLGVLGFAEIMVKLDEYASLIGACADHTLFFVAINRSICAIKKVSRVVFSKTAFLLHDWRCICSI